MEKTNLETLEEIEAKLEELDKKMKEIKKEELEIAQKRKPIEEQRSKLYRKKLEIEKEIQEEKRASEVGQIPTPKPCPLCGGEVHIQNHQYADFPSISVTCSKCYLGFTRCKEDTEDGYELKKRAIEEWNTRK